MGSGAVPLRLGALESWASLGESGFRLIGSMGVSEYRDPNIAP